MATFQVTIPADNVFHLIADGATYSSVYVEVTDDGDALKMAVATALPAASSDDFIILQNDADIGPGITIPLLPTEKIYGQAYGGSDGTKARCLPLGLAGFGQGAGLVAPVGGVVASANFVPTAVAYGALSNMDTAKAFAFVTAAGGQPVPAGSLIKLHSSLLKIDVAALQASEAAYNLALYSVTPPSAQANNTAWTLASADLPSYRGTLGIGTPVDAGAALFIKTQFTDQQYAQVGAGGQLFGELITVAGFTATAVARQVTLYGNII